VRVGTGRCVFIVFALAALSSCGYHAAGKGELLPPTLKTISIPAFGNITTRYKLTDRLPEAISREFLTRTHYRIVSREEAADAVLRGNVINYAAYTAILDPDTSRAAAVELRVMLQLTLVERATGKALFSRPAFEVRERYQISTTAERYYDESEDALIRVSRQVAQQVVTAILENF
jgi:outer membrane lipopolysaccharide assembly protein LptE/RlpB